MNAKYEIHIFNIECFIQLKFFNAFHGLSRKQDGQYSKIALNFSMAQAGKVGPG